MCNLCKGFDARRLACASTLVVLGAMLSSCTEPVSDHAEDSPADRIAIGMNETQIIKILGTPDRSTWPADIASLNDGCDSYAYLHENQKFFLHVYYNLGEVAKITDANPLMCAIL